MATINTTVTWQQAGGYPSGGGPEAYQLAAADQFSSDRSWNLVNATPFEKGLTPCRILHFC